MPTAGLMNLELEVDSGHFFKMIWNMVWWSPRASTCAEPQDVFKHWVPLVGRRCGPCHAGGQGIVGGTSYVLRILAVMLAPPTGMGVFTHSWV